MAFGDDAAVAGGLVGRSAAGPVFCGDAIADPLTGLESVLAVADSLRRGGGEIVEVSMAAVAAIALQSPATAQGPTPSFPFDAELVKLTLAITVINTWNRLNCTFRVEAGGYRAGMFDFAKTA